MVIKVRQTTLDELALPFSDTEGEIIRIIARTGRDVSPYEIAKKTELSYPGIFKYCKVLETKKYLESSVGLSVKGLKKNLYSLTFRGISWFIVNTHDIYDRYEEFSKILTSYETEYPVFTCIKSLCKKISQYKDKNAIAGYHRDIITVFVILFSMPNNEKYSSRFEYQVFRTLIEGMLSKSDLQANQFHMNQFIPDVLCSFKESPRVWEEISQYFKDDFTRTVLYEVRFYSLIYSKEEVIKRINETIEPY